LYESFEEESRVKMQESRLENTEEYPRGKEIESREELLVTTPTTDGNTDGYRRTSAAGRRKIVVTRPEASDCIWW
jgi:hypothetical protein